MALAVLKSNGFLQDEASPTISVARSRHASQGDYSSNLAMLLAKPNGRKSQEIGKALIAALPLNDAVKNIVIGGPGFINFYLTSDRQTSVVSHVLEEGSQFGRSDQGAGRRLLVEVVSVNAIGLLQIGHGREAVLGDTVANLLQALGYEIERVFRVTDAGRQLGVLAEDKEVLCRLGIQFNSNLKEYVRTDDAGSVIDKLESAGHLYTEGGMRWFRSTAFGNDKDQVMVLANGSTTTLASDLASIDNQLARGFEKVVHVSGVDLQEQAAHLKAAVAALSLPAGSLEFLLVQPTVTRHSGQRSPLLTRTDDAPLRELFDETGKDVARFFYLMRSHRQHLEIVLELAASLSCENPLYCVQYACARISSVERQFGQRGLIFNRTRGLRSLVCLAEGVEADILILLATYPEVVVCAACDREPHQLIEYLRDLANALHTYYNAHKILAEDAELRDARFCLMLAVRQVLENGLTLIDVSTPEVM
ncbi:MAG: arginine--tRNA ligase [Granulosicoccus sp.]